MPFIRAYANTETGESHPNAFWYPARFNVDYLGLEITCTYVGHVDQSHLDKKPVSWMVKEFALQGQAFVDLLKQIAVQPTDPNVPLPVAIAAMLDQIVLGLKTEDSGEKDEQDNPILVSFFEGLTPLPPDLSVLK